MSALPRRRALAVALCGLSGLALPLAAGAQNAPTNMPYPGINQPGASADQPAAPMGPPVAQPLTPVGVQGVAVPSVGVPSRSLVAPTPLPNGVAVQPGAPLAPLPPPPPPVGASLATGQNLTVDRPAIPPEMLAAMAPRPGGITLEGAVRRALQNNPGMRVSHANTLAAEAAVAESGRAMIPSLSGFARYTRLSDVPAEFRSLNIAGLPPGMGIAFPQLLDTFTFQATLTIPLSDIPFRLLRFYQAAGYTAEARRIDEESTQLQVALETRLAYVEWLRALGTVAATMQSLESLRLRLEDARRLVAAGTVARVQLLQLQAQVAGVERLIVSGQNAVQLSELGLRQRMRMTDNEQLALGETFDTPVVVPSNLQNLLNQAMHNRSELRSLERQARSLGATIAGNQATYFPSLSAVGNAYIASPNQRAFGQSTTRFLGTWDASLQLSWSPTAAIVAASTVARLDAQRVALVAQADQIHDNIETEVRSQWVGTRNAVARIEAARATLEANTEVARVRREQFNAGATTATELSNAESDLLRAHLDLLDSWLELRVAAARLRRAVGEPESTQATAGSGR